MDRLLEVVDCLYDTYNTSPDGAYQIRNAIAHHDELFAMIDYRKILPLVVDVLGVNIQIRTSHVDIRPPMLDYVDNGLGTPRSFFPWHADGPNYGYPITNGIIPFFEVKVGYYLTDLTQHNSGAICVVRGSHRLSPQLIHDPNYRIKPQDIVEVNVCPGTAMLWRTALWHCVTPNLSGRKRGSGTSNLSLLASRTRRRSTRNVGGGTAREGMRIISITITKCQRYGFLLRK